MMTPSMFLMLEEILLAIALLAAVVWYVARRQRAPAGGMEVERRLPKYHPLLVLIHWFVAFALANLLLRGALIMRYVPNNDPEKIDGLRAHMYAGTLVLVLMLIRLVVRRRSQHPPRATARNHHLDRLAQISHRLLYVLVIAQALSGLYMAVQTGLPDVLILGRGTLPEDFLGVSDPQCSLRAVAAIDGDHRAPYHRRAVSHLHPQGRVVAPHEFWAPHRGE